MAVPDGGASAAPCPAVQSPVCFPEDLLRVVADQDIRSLGQRDGSLRRIPDGDAGDVEDRRLLLDTAGVGENEFRVGHEVEKIEVTQRFEAVDASGPALALSFPRRGRDEGRRPSLLEEECPLQAEGRDLFPCPGVDGKEDGDSLGDPPEPLDDPAEGLRICPRWPGDAG